MLKMDAEGMEVEILRGARQLLTRTGQIVMETHGQARHDGALTLLREAGFGIDENRFEGSTGVLAGSRPRSWKAEGPPANACERRWAETGALPGLR
jgi:hypothetical protein